MILDKEFVVKICKYNIIHYSQFFDVKLKDIIILTDLENQLQKGTNKKINVECDICHIHRYIHCQSYFINKSSCPKYPIYTCDKCSHIKLKEFNMNKYGVEYYSQYLDRNNKVKNTSIRKYGVEHFSKSSQFTEKVSKTNLEKFGISNPFMDSDRVKRKFKEKYGVEHPSQVDEFKEKIKNTNIERYGVDNPLLSIEIRKKINDTNIDRYGGHPMKNDNIRNSIITNDKNYIKYIKNCKSLFKCDLGRNHLFELTSELYHNRIRSSISLCTICNPIGELSSIKETDIFNYILSIYSGDIISNYRDGLEIDIYLPELKIGFEFNGLYWHSDEYKDKNYHLNKTNYFKDKDIRIIHIWEDDWIDRKDIVKSMISNLIANSNKKIFARKCEIKIINSIPIVRNFLNENHIQGFVNSVIKLGLYHQGNLVSIMIFDHNEGRKKMSNNEWNLSRFCNVLNTNVIGGASKLLSYFIKNYKPTRIVSYADKDWSIGNLYYRLNFKLEHETNPDYKYLLKNNRIHKSRFRKSKLDTNLSESQFMKNKSIYKIWDCGKIKFCFTI